MRGGLLVWMAKRVPWRWWYDAKVTVNGKTYIAVEIVEKLMKERDTLSRKHSRERKRRGEVEKELRTLRKSR